MAIVHHDVKGVVDAAGKERGRCNSGGDEALSTGSFCGRTTNQREPNRHRNKERSSECHAYFVPILEPFQVEDFVNEKTVYTWNVEHRTIPSFPV